MATTDERRIKPRKAWVAVVLSLLTAGVGHVYCGRLARGLVFFCVTLAGTGIALAAASLSEVAASPVAVTALLVTKAIGLGAVIDSYLIARRVPHGYVLTRYNRWYVYLALVILDTVPASIGTDLHLMGHVRAFYIPNDSMAPTFIHGDRIVVELKAYAETGPQRGDVVVFASPDQPRVTSVKRIVALAGDTVEMRGGQVHVNGQRLERTPLDRTDPAWAAAPKEADLCWEHNQGARYRVITPKGPADGDFAETTVPSGCVFVLGDNRGHSRDSRHFGPISRLDIRGKARYLYWPARDWDRFGPVK